MSIHNKIRDFQNLHQKVTNLNIIQDFINIAGSDMPVDNKIKEINNVIIEKYEVKYSTIVLFDGANYVIRATNVDQKHWDTLSSLHELDIFKDSIETTNPKYITVNNERERLPYQRSEFGRAKSAVFFPLYIDNIYIGYWLIESGIPHYFDNIDITVFETAKENMISAMKSVNYQKTLESLVRKDLFSGLNSAEYLYAKGKKIIDQYVSSAVCMFKIANIEEINKISRELGNRTITKVSDFIKRSISDNYIFVRYMGPKFVIVFCGVDVGSASNFINELKDSVEKLSINQSNITKVVDGDVNRDDKITVTDVIELCEILLGNNIVKPVIGDVNGDGAVTATDLIFLYDYLFNDDQQYSSSCDIDGDGNVTATDLRVLQEILLSNGN